MTAFTPGASPPSVAHNTATADNYWIGTMLAEAFENTTRLFTNGSGNYCTTQQEDNATLGGAHARFDFWACGLFPHRTVSDFDHPFPGQTAAEGLFTDHGGFQVSLNKIRIAGVEIIQGIIDDWEHKFKAGVRPDNYIGDVFSAMGSQPSFGPGSLFNGHQAPSTRSLSLRKRGRGLEGSS